MSEEVIIAFCLAWIAGMITGRFFKDPVEDCPRVILGYNCMGKNWCDHRESVLYTNMATMARNREESENKNLWGGDRNE